MMRLDRTVLLETLRQIQDLTTNFIKYKDRYGELIPDDPRSTPAEFVVEAVNESDSNSFPDIMAVFKKQRHSSGLKRSLPKRLKWASFYKEKYEKLVARLQELNDVLIDLVDSNTRVAIRNSTRETSTTILHLHSKVDDLVQLFEALVPEKPASLSACSLSSNYDSALYTLQKQELAELTYFKAINTSIESNTALTFSGIMNENKQPHNLKLARSDIHLHTGFEGAHNRCEADYQENLGPREAVWVEWREYEPLMQAQLNLNPSRVDKLVSLLSDVHKPDLLRVPHCLGYFIDPEGDEIGFRRRRLGFVFEKPSSTCTAPISLRRLIEIRKKPLLTERVSLAKAIANSLMSLHSVNWLHKGLRSENIIFFSKGSSGIEFSCPYLSGFDYARPAFREDMTERVSEDPEADMYRHPRTHGFGPFEARQGFKRTFDIYSLGIVLVEIATWRVVEAVLNIEEPKLLDVSALRSIQARLLNEKCHLEDVGANAGSNFSCATRNCLDSTAALGIGHMDDENNVQVAAKVSQNFYHYVLLPLEEIQT